MQNRRDPQEVVDVVKIIINDEIVLEGTGKAIEFKYKDHSKWQIHLGVNNGEE